MAATIVQNTFPSGGYYGDFASAVTSGNSVVAVGVINSGGTAIAATFNGQAMTLIDLGSSSLGFKMLCFYRHNHTGGGTQCLTSSTGFQVTLLRLYEVSGLDNAVPEVSQRNSGSGTSSAASGTYTVTSGAFGATWLHENAGTPAAGAPSGWTLDGTAPNGWYSGQASRVFASGATTSHTWTMPSNATYDVGTVSFSAGGAAAAAGALPFLSRQNLPHLIVR